MLEELERRNYAPGTIRCYIRVVEQFARRFRRPPDQLGLEHIRQYQAALLRQKKLAPSTVGQHLAGLRFFYIQPAAEPCASSNGSPPRNSCFARHLKWTAALHEPPSASSIQTRASA
jgi:site-specific recombinase XerD